MPKIISSGCCRGGIGHGEALPASPRRCNRITGLKALVVGVSLIIAGVTAAARSRFALRLGTVAAIVFAAWGFVGNYVLFAAPRLSHTEPTCWWQRLLSGENTTSLSPGASLTSPSLAPVLRTAPVAQIQQRLQRHTSGSKEFFVVCRS
jgi:hypothetical protein